MVVAGRHYWRELGGGCRVRRQSPVLLKKKRTQKDDVTCKGDMMTVRAGWSGPQPLFKQKKNKQSLGSTVINLATMNLSAVKSRCLKRCSAKIIPFPKRPLSVQEGLFIEMRASAS
jgi:hypothetical protein